MMVGAGALSGLSLRGLTLRHQQSCFYPVRQQGPEVSTSDEVEWLEESKLKREGAPQLYLADNDY